MYQGKQGMIWFTGIVEDRNDPLALNRVRVRIYGAHTHDKSLIATPDLPWTDVLMPTTSPSLSGLGRTTHGLVEGSTVMGFYRDGSDQQDPVIFGSLVGIPQDFYRIDETIDDKMTRSFTEIKRKTTDGFNDPRLDTKDSYEGTPDGPNPEHLNRTYGLTLSLDKSPRRDGLSAGESYPKSSYIEKSDINFLSKGDATQYPVINLSKGEPDRATYVAPIYPFNHVHETESGHVLELDDTPDKERIHLYHRKGTRYEIDNAGTVIEKIVKDKYTLILGENKVKIQGAVDIEVGESIVSNTIAAAGGSEKLTEDATSGIVNEDGTLTDTTKQKLSDAGVTEDQITEIESDKSFKDAVTSSAKEAIDNMADEETVKDKVSLKTVIDTVESIDTETKAGVDSVVKEVSGAVGGLTEETEHVIDTALREVTAAGDSVNAAIDFVESELENKKQELEDTVLNELGINAVKEKLEAKFTEAVASVEALQAEVTEKVTTAVSETATKVLGEELGGKVGEIVTEQLTSAVTSVALSAIGGVLGSNLVNVTVAGSAKIKTMGSTTVQSLGGSTNITSAMSTNITTLTGGTNITTAVGTTNITNGVGAINLTAPITNILSPVINTTGVLNHTGAMNVFGILTGGAITSPIIQSGAAFLATHTHPIVSGSSAGSTTPGVG